MYHYPFTDDHKTLFRLMVRNGGWSGTPSALQIELHRLVEHCLLRDDWPTQPRLFGKWLRHIKSKLTDLGISMEFGRARDRQRSRLIYITQLPTPSALEELPEVDALPEESSPPIPSQEALAVLCRVMLAGNRFIDLWTENGVLCARGTVCSIPLLESLFPYVEELAAFVPGNEPLLRRSLENWNRWYFGRTREGTMALLPRVNACFG